MHRNPFSEASDCHELHVGTSRPVRTVPTTAGCQILLSTRSALSNKHSTASPSWTSAVVDQPSPTSSRLEKATWRDGRDSFVSRSRAVRRNNVNPELGLQREHKLVTIKSCLRVYSHSTFNMICRFSSTVRKPRVKAASFTQNNKW